jgi:hypothetical protein
VIQTKKTVGWWQCLLAKEINDFSEENYELRSILNGNLKEAGYLSRMEEDDIVKQYPDWEPLAIWWYYELTETGNQLRSELQNPHRRQVCLVYPRKSKNVMDDIYIVYDMTPLWVNLMPLLDYGTRDTGQVRSVYLHDHYFVPIKHISFLVEEKVMIEAPLRRLALMFHSLHDLYTN